MDHVTPNLPARDFAVTAAFYAALGFTERYRGPEWMILERGPLWLEFFPFPDFDPDTSAFGACLRLDAIDPLYAACVAAGIPEGHGGRPQLHPPAMQPFGLRMAALIDPDGSLIRLIENPRA